MRVLKTVLASVTALFALAALMTWVQLTYFPNTIPHRYARLTGGCELRPGNTCSEDGAYVPLGSSNKWDMGKTQVFTK